MFSLQNLLSVAEVLRDVSQSLILPRFQNLDDGAIRAKSSIHDLVTDVDEAAERAITPTLNKLFPTAVIVGEESTAADPSLLDRIGGAELAFVLDPIDGTKNFASGLPLFGVMVAAIERGEVVGAIIHDPVMNDFACALRGEGAWVEHRDGRRVDLRVAAPVPIDDMNGLVSWAYLPEPERSRATANLPRFAVTSSYRCAAHEYRLLAGGHCDFAVYAKLMPWDHAPGWLLHREAGGYSARFDGSAYRPTLHGGGLICASDAASWNAIKDALFSDCR
ncbi:MAG: inositol monophosphatase [Chelatococcus sp.]|uniref:inositol monophosphatase family protein n=1 Tax=Chelatococcus sp. TaxID=1953771 RepID=UPI0025BF9D35|nr:inositol monophosphatase family protein [Chelatococcus sp.]MBX3536754.1 inositol monophosphatase [Chelatococcus sp.]